MKFRVLGSVELVDGGGKAVPLPRKARLLLAALLARADAVVTVDALIDAVWGERPPASAVHVIHNHVNRLRASVEPDPRHPSVLLRTDAGYRLAIDGEQLDSARFERLLEAGRRATLEGAPHEAVSTLTEALALWQGPAYGDLADTDSVRHEARRLEELRLLAEEEQVEARIATGEDSILVSELETLVAAHPLREQLWAQLIRCLYRSGRQADALAAYQRLRAHLGEQLGLEPSPALRSLEAKVLAQAAELSAAPPPRTSAVTAVDRPSTAPLTRYARTPDGVNIAYQVAGDGPVDFLVVPGFTSHLDLWWELWPRFAREISSFTRLILFDKRGMGLSDRPPAIGADRWVVDALAVLDAARSERAVLFGMSGGGTVAALLAATHPERARSLVLFGSRARYVRDSTYPYGTDPDRVDTTLTALEEGWGTGIWFDYFCPSAVHDQARWDEFARFQRMSASPGAAATYLGALLAMDIRWALPAITVPTLMLHATGDLTDTIDQARYMAARIPGARLVELDSDDHLLWLSDRLDRIITEIRHFVAGEALPPVGNRILATVLTVTCDDHTVRHQAEQTFSRNGGHRLPGDSRRQRWRFDAPGTALRCALAVRAQASPTAAQLGAGAHCGECETGPGEAMTGPAIDIADAVASMARPGEILVSQTVRDLLVGSAITVEPRGQVTVAGVPGRWQVLAVTGR